MPEETRAELQRELDAIEGVESELDRRILRIESVLDDHPLRQFIPLGLPGSFACVECRRVFMGRFFTADGLAECPGCGQPCEPTRGQQYAAAMSDSIEILASGGNRSGKSKFLVWRWCLDLTGDYPDWYPQQFRLFPGETHQRPVKLRLLAPTYEKGINDVIWPLFMELLPRSMRIDPRRNSQGGITLAAFPNGAEESFLTYSQPVKYLEGWHGHGAGFDEPPDNKAYYTATMRGLLDLNGRSILAITPIKTCAWVDKRFMRVRPRETYKNSGPYTTMPARFSFDLSDNPTVREERKEHFEDLLDPEERASRIKGDLIAQNYLVLRRWDDRLHVDSAPVIQVVNGRTFIKDELYKAPSDRLARPEGAADLPGDGWAPVTLYMFVDPHDAKPQAIIWLAVWPPGPLGVSKKRLIRHLFDPSTTTFDQAVKLVKEIEQEIGLPELRIMDPNFGWSPYANTGLLCHQEWAAAGERIGWPMYFVKAIDSVELGHNAVRKALLELTEQGQPEFAVCANCWQVIDACRYGSYTGNYEIDRKSPFKDWLDLLRYACMAQLEYVPPSSAEPSQADFEYTPDPVAGY